VDELIVFCSNKNGGCSWSGERQNLRQHLENCEYQLKSCKWNCGWKGLDVIEHEESCSLAMVVCTECDQPILKSKYEKHVIECTPEKEECILCRMVVLKKRMDSHAMVCPQSSVICPQSRFGCSWNGKREDLTNHCANCPFDKLSDFFVRYQAHQDHLVEENSKLKEKCAELENHIYDINCKVMDLMGRATLEDGGSPLFPPMVLDTFAHELRMLRTDMEQLNITSAQADLKRDQQHASDQTRLRDEIQSIRSLCHTLQMQIFNLAVRNPSLPNTSSSSHTAPSTKKSNTKL
jgi:hypothetical protein